MITIYVTYSGDAATRFDREYYVRRHLPLVREGWAAHGLASAAGFFPAEDGPGIIALCVCTFRDVAAWEAAFRSPQTPGIMADIANFTDVAPARSQAMTL
jgi:uncharacterized protein (TIGR02118 family)